MKRPKRKSHSALVHFLLGSLWKISERNWSHWLSLFIYHRVMSPQKYETCQHVVYLIARDRKMSSNSKWMLLSSRQLKRDALKMDVKIDFSSNSVSTSWKYRVPILAQYCYNLQYFWKISIEDGIMLVVYQLLLWVFAFCRYTTQEGENTCFCRSNTASDKCKPISGLLSRCFNCFCDAF